MFIKFENVGSIVFIDDNISINELLFNNNNRNIRLSKIQIETKAKYKGEIINVPRDDLTK